MSDDFTEEQTATWQYLNYELACNKPSRVRLCCWPKKVDCSAASRLAQLMLTSRDRFYVSAAEIEKYELKCAQRKEEKPLPSCDRPEDWTELSQWKHPELDLDLLQVAIVCRHLSGVKYLWQDCLKEKEKYLDASSKLVNHPWHLIFALKTGYENVLPFQEADVEVFLQKGKVDLKTALLRKWPEIRRFVECKMDILLSESNIGLDRMEDDHAFHFWQKICSKTVEKMLTAQAQPSTVECLWKLVWDNLLYRNVLDLCLINKGNVALDLVIESHGPVRRGRTQLAEECLILLCQLWFKKTWYDTAHPLCRTLCKALKCGIPLMKAASVLQPPDVRQVIEFMKHVPEVNKNSHSQDLLEDFIGMTSGVTSLQNLCILSVLRAVNGDVRKVWAMSELPEPVKTLFHVPFKTLHDQLKADN